MKKSLYAVIPLAAAAIMLFVFFPNAAIDAGNLINNRIPALGELWSPSEPSPAPTPEPTPAPTADPLYGVGNFMQVIEREIDLAYPQKEELPEPAARPSKPMPTLTWDTKLDSSRGNRHSGNGLRGQPLTEEELQALPVPDFAPDPENLVFKSEEWLARYGRGYYLVVNNKANTVTVYAAEYGKGYNVPAKVFVCSTGRDTPRFGFFELGVKKRWVWLFNDVFGQYSTEICGDILFHSVPYEKLYNPASLEYAEFDKLGTSASLGCVRLQVKDARWIFRNKHRIVGVQFIEEDDPGPLGKPEAMKIAHIPGYRIWDPTDPDPQNLWKKYFEEN